MYSIQNIKISFEGLEQKVNAFQINMKRIPNPICLTVEELKRTKAPTMNRHVP
ncbi:hypothetical protein [Solibacillus sp.]|uniref:hypothetical protein n=1 Tax=Solibacillus sp. TaxID=1909654 RepID=UPI003314827D